MNYQLLLPLRDEERAALEADIQKRGVMVPVEIDENGDILDGHHRVEIARRLGLKYPSIRRKFSTEEEKREHVLQVNLARRHLGPLGWGLAFAKLLEVKGVGRGRGARNDKTTSDNVSEVAQAQGVNERTARRRLRLADAFNALPGPEQKAVLACEKPEAELAKRAREKANTARRRRNPVLARDGKADVILCDPPWKYEFSRSPAREIENQYPTMAEEEIAALPVAKAAAKDAVLFLWATSPKLCVALRVMDAWGFEYKTCAIWDKEKIGMGYYFRQAHEILLVGTRGKPQVPEEKSRPPSVIRAKRGKHSEKPEAVYTLIERMYPSARRLEMFARARRQGWFAFGNEIE